MIATAEHKARYFGGFAEDVKTDEDAIEVLRKYAGTDLDAWDLLILSGKLPLHIRTLALEERNKLRKEHAGPV